MGQPPKDSIISYFRSIYHKKPASKKTGDEMTILKFLDLVKREHFKKQIDQIYAEPDKEKRSKLKTQLPAVTISGKFLESRNAALLQHSGFICLDFDHVPDMDIIIENLISDQYTYALFKSASGQGLACIVKIDTEPDKHKGSFRRLSDYYLETYQLVCDVQCSDLKRFRFVSSDPNLFNNPRSKKWTKSAIQVIEREEAKRNLSTVVAPSDLQRIVEEIETRGIDITNGYMYWRNIGFALSALGEQGRDIFHRISSINPVYDQPHCERQFSACLSGRGETQIKIGTFYYYCQSAGIELRSERTKRAIEIATMRKAAESNQRDASDLIAKKLEVSKPEAEAIVAQVWTQQNIQSGLNTPTRIRMFIDMNYTRRYNELEQRLYINGKAYDRDYEHHLTQSLREAIGEKAQHADIKNSFKDLVSVQAYNPLKEWFERHTPIKPIGIIDQIADMIPSSTRAGDMTAKEFRRVYFRKWLVGMIANVYEAYDKSELELMLIGGPGTGKTRFFKYLLPEDLHEYYEDDTLDASNERDNYFTLSRKMLIVDNEGGSKNHSQIERSKRIIGLRHKSLRSLGTDHEIVRLNLIATLGVTSNNVDVLKDPTGNRRKIPLFLGGNRINIEGYRNINKTELLMEAWHAYKNQEPYYLSDMEVDLFVNSFDQFKEIDPVYEAILYLYKPAPVGSEFKVTFRRISEQVRAYNQWLTQYQINRMKYVLSQNFKPFRFADGSRGYHVEYTDDYHQIKRDQDNHQS